GGPYINLHSRWTTQPSAGCPGRQRGADAGVPAAMVPIVLAGYPRATKLKFGGGRRRATQHTHRRWVPGRYTVEGELILPVQHNQCINGNWPASGKYDRVNVDFLNGSLLHSNVTHFDHDVSELINVRGGHTTKCLQDFLGFDLAYHLQRFCYLYWRHTKRDIPEHLREDASQTEHHARAELGISCETHDQLSTSPDHLLNQYA